MPGLGFQGACSTNFQFQFQFQSNSIFIKSNFVCKFKFVMPLAWINRQIPAVCRSILFTDFSALPHILPHPQCAGAAHVKKYDDYHLNFFLLKKNSSFSDFLHIVMDGLGKSIWSNSASILDAVIWFPFCPIHIFSSYFSYFFAGLTKSAAIEQQQSDLLKFVAVNRFGYSMVIFWSTGKEIENCGWITSVHRISITLQINGRGFLPPWHSQLPPHFHDGTTPTPNHLY